MPTDGIGKVGSGYSRRFSAIAMSLVTKFVIMFHEHLSAM